MTWRRESWKRLYFVGRTPLQYCPLTDVWGQAHTLGTQLQRVVLQRILVVFCYLSKNHQDYSLQQDRAMSSIYKDYLIYVLPPYLFTCR